MNPQSQAVSARLYYVALLLPPGLAQKISALQHWVRDTYDSQAALRSPPHITLQLPFRQTSGQLVGLKRLLAEFVWQTSPIKVELSGFGSFPPRVVYVDVVVTPALMAVQHSFIQTLEKHLPPEPEQQYIRSFQPHVTIAFRDLSCGKFKTLWAAVQNEPFRHQFMAGSLGLLRHTGIRWIVDCEYPFDSRSDT